MHGGGGGECYTINEKRPNIANKSECDNSNIESKSQNTESKGDLNQDSKNNFNIESNQASIESNKPLSLDSNNFNIESKNLVLNEAKNLAKNKKDSIESKSQDSKDSKNCIESNTLSPAHHPINGKDSIESTNQTPTTKKIDSNIESNTNTKQIEHFHFHIISDGLSQSNLQNLKILESSLNKNSEYSKITLQSTIHTHIISTNEFDNQAKWGFEATQSHSAYFRLLIDRILPKNIEKILYLDTDMLVLCDVRELFRLDLKDKILASSSGYITPTPSFREFQPFDKTKEPLKIMMKNSFCSGLMLINMKEWREQNIESKALDFLRDYKSEFADQDALNAVILDSISLKGSYGILIYQYILASKQKQKEYEQILNNIKIIHCNGPAKAWSNFFYFADSNIKHLVCDTWWEIALGTSGFEEVFKDLHKKLQADALSYCVKYLRNDMESINVKIESLQRKVFRISYPHKAFRNFLRRIFNIT
ncbi:hypothetical protein DCO58_07680 [Helicobacter saguini]|uniref:Glycosyltransferase family 8 protein n=1 Tax=Helicobacter saguini TaxID=1548018 RepID=A0A4U8T1Y5_9HELI|nr:hypothetical protein [Helicobacter saguini]TLD93248.1 glycosyltransferase family 8 protein [Helicobacter saguini]